MAEHILGIGKKASLRDVIQTAEKQLGVLEGAPREIVARTHVVEVIADREGFEGPFERYRVRLQMTDAIAERVNAVVNEFSDVCSRTTDGAGEVFEFSGGDGSAEPERVFLAVDRLSECSDLPETWRIHGDRYRMDPISVELLFKAMVQYRASDVHVCPGSPPVFRVDGETRTSELLGVVSAVQVTELIRSISSDDEWLEFEERMQVSFNFHQVGLGFSRVSAFMKAGVPHVTFRFLPEVIPSFEELNIPPDTMKTLADLHHGLLLVTGMTGSGKSTTVAAIVDWINSNKSLHILSIENPVEYVHRNKRAMVSQRNTGKDVQTFGEAVTGALRHDPDVIVIGEMRDADTIRSAINAAATGHLVISTLHSNTASEVVNRIISFFDPVERDLVKLQLRDALRCVICQRLLPRIGGGRIPTLELMFNDIKPINDGIINGDTDAMRIGMQQSISHSFLFEKYLHGLYKDGMVDLEHARLFCTEVSILDQLIMGTYSIPRLDSIKAAREASVRY